jgi:hypothetical protein
MLFGEAVTSALRVLGLGRGGLDTASTWSLCAGRHGGGDALSRLPLSTHQGRTVVLARGARRERTAISFPLAHLFELGGKTIWAPAVLHAAVQGGVNVVVPAEPDPVFALVWILCSAVISFLVFLVPRAQVVRSW